MSGKRTTPMFASRTGTTVCLPIHRGHLRATKSRTLYEYGGVGGGERKSDKFMKFRECFREKKNRLSLNDRYTGNGRPVPALSTRYLYRAVPGGANISTNRKTYVRPTQLRVDSVSVPPGGADTTSVTKRFKAYRRPSETRKSARRKRNGPSGRRGTRTLSYRRRMFLRHRRSLRRLSRALLS